MDFPHLTSSIERKISNFYYEYNILMDDEFTRIRHDNRWRKIREGLERAYPNVDKATVSEQAWRIEVSLLIPEIYGYGGILTSDQVMLMHDDLEKHNFPGSAKFNNMRDKMISQYIDAYLLEEHKLLESHIRKFL